MGGQRPRTGEVGSVPRRVVVLSFLSTTPSADARSTVTLCREWPSDCDLEAADRFDHGPSTRCGAHSRTGSSKQVDFVAGNLSAGYRRIPCAAASPLDGIEIE